jgi:phage terminase large subunit-like protein
MRWCVGNVAAKEDRKGGILPHKPSKNRQIDGVVATINALGRMIVEPSPVLTPQAFVLEF